MISDAVSEDVDDDQYADDGGRLTLDQSEIL